MKKRLLISLLTLLTCGLTTGLWASSIPGALSGRFTINASGEKVVFSQGNLQYVGTWQFAENQWDCFSTSQYNDHRDLFGWGTGDAPNKVSDNNGDYGTFTDWGTNAITNGGNTENSGWRTLTKDEWVYLFYSRENAATLFGFGSVNGMNGLIILPDNWTTPEGASFTASTTLGLTNLGSYYHNDKNDNYTHNTYTAEQWAVMESAGAVFLPAAAYRHWLDSSIKYTDLGGFYWSSTPYDSDMAYYLNFYYNDLAPQFKEMRCGGRPVRLVRSSLEQDAEGNYLLSSADDWKDFAAIVNSGTNPAANAKMTADIDLGDDQTHIGDNNNLSYAYCGVFDGQGHKLNVNYYSSSSSTAIEGGYSIAPFRNIKGATIKNLAVTGNITGYMHCAGVVGYAASPSTNLINNVTVSANITILNTHGGGFIGHNESATTTIQDCLFNGTINGKSGGSTVGVFFGWSGKATMSLINCLENGSYTNCSTFTPTSCPNYAVSTVTNCYYAVSGSYPGTHATSAQLADGTTSTALQNGRAEEVWVQDPMTNQPMLKLFANTVFAYTVSNDEVTITGFASDFTVPDNYDLVIPDEIKGMPVVAIKDRCFYDGFSNKDRVRSVSFGRNLRTTGKMGFCNFTNLSTVTFANNSRLETLGWSCFNRCPLTSIELPDGLLTIEANALSSTQLENIEIPASLTGGGEAFMGENSKLKTVTFKGSCPTPLAPWFNSGDSWLVLCPLLESVTVPLEHLDNYASQSKTCGNKALIKSSYTLPSSGVGTFSTGVAVTLSEGLDAYYCKDYADGKISVTAINGPVPANTGVLLKGTPGETYTLTGTNNEATTVTGNALVAVTVATHVDPIDGDYTNFMLKSGTFIRIAASDDDVKMPANKAYLQIQTSQIDPEPASARAIRLSWGGGVTDVPLIDNGQLIIDNYSLPAKRIVNGNLIIEKNGQMFNTNGQLIK